MINVMFVCLGNICRSPMAEFILKDMVRKRGIADDFCIASSATSPEELGNPLYPPAARKLASEGVPTTPRRAVTLKKSDYDKYDYIIAMERRNVENIKHICCGDPDNKVSLLLSLPVEMIILQTHGIRETSMGHTMTLWRAATAS